MFEAPNYARYLLLAAYSMHESDAGVFEMGVSDVRIEGLGWECRCRSQR